MQNPITVDSKSGWCLPFVYIDHVDYKKKNKSGLVKHT